MLSIRLAGALGMLLAATGGVRAEASAAQRLVSAYPEYLQRVEGNDLVWRDGTRMPIDDGRPAKSFEQRLASPDIDDMFYAPYPPGRNGLPPGHLMDPGRMRNAALFTKMYGKCRTGEVARNLVEIAWLPKTAPQKLLVTRVNGVAAKLQAISQELETLSPDVRKFLSPSAGTYVCRPVADTGQPSPHGYGIAIDISAKLGDYWHWSSRKDGAPIAWKNRVPLEIVEIFEKHGFVWGGKWYHYDTMHFEYRPELLPARP